MQPEWTIAPHKIVYIDHSPLAKAIFAKPLDQGLQFISRLEVRRRLHLVLEHHQVLIGIQFLRDGQLRHCEAQRRLNQHQNTQEHLLVPLVNRFVGLRVGESLVIVG